MLLLKSVLLGLAAFAVYTLLYLVYAVYPGPHGAVTTNVIWIYTIGNPMWWGVGVLLVVFAYALLRRRSKSRRNPALP